jgi:two-component system CheB/CheR fusion protein
VTEERDQDFESLLRFLRQSRGFDFTGYKRSTLMRRVRKRMDQLKIQGFTEYHDYLQVHLNEFVELFNTILINVTSFFRDPSAWEYVADQIIPRIVATKNGNDQIRVWSAGCASGEEPYTAAMLLAEALGMQMYRERVKIYATDVDDDALVKARQGSMELKQLSDIPDVLREKYVEVTGNRHVLKSDLRRNVVFGRHDLLQDAPISRVDLLTCRNALMYFEAETQAKILARFHYALAEKGFLFLGKAEMLLTREGIFQPVDLKQRVFVKVPRIKLRDRIMALAQTETPEAGNHANPQAWLAEAAGNATPLAQIVVDAAGYLALANERARTLFGIDNSDIGRPVQDLEISYRPVELRSRLDQVKRERRPVEIAGAEQQLNSGQTRYVDVSIAPLTNGGGVLLGTSITFTDVTSSKQLQQEVQRHRQELETASEELQSTNEELETTNEELQSTVEELETTNEELQSSNEELETMNEELESTNNELQIINAELHRRSGQLDHVNAFMAAILSSLRLGVSVLDRDLRVQLWNRQAEELWGVRSEEVVGQPMLRLDIGLPVEQLAQPLTECLTGKVGGFRETSVAATNRRGRSIRCRVICTPLIAENGSPPDGVVILMEEVDGLVRVTGS